jgi:hypothetical protein
MSFVADDWQSITQLSGQAVLRNLRITQGYHELSVSFARMLGPENITWFTFASWSSKVVGQYLQNAALPELLRDWLEGSGSNQQRVQRLNTQLGSLHGAPSDVRTIALDTAIKRAIHDVRMYLALGNTEVFAELAPAFGGFLAQLGADSTPDRRKLEHYLSTLRAGPAEPDTVAVDPSTRELKLVARGGQTSLIEAARAYYEAKFELDPKRRAELILLANAKVGLHEQTRLQTYIAGSLNAPIGSMLASATENELAKRIGDEMLGAAGQAIVKMLLAPITDLLQDIFHRLATELMMTLKLPDGVLRLGSDLPAAPGQPLFPKLLRTIEDPELAALLAKYNALAERAEELEARRLIENTVEELLGKLGIDREIAIGTGADDWVSLNERMRYILELFRSRQQTQLLLQPTFTASQVAAMKAGRIPDGPLT